MNSREAESRVEILQIYRLLQYIHKKDKEQIEKMVKFGVKNLINLTEPKDGVGALHVAVSANNSDMVGFLLSQGAHPDLQDKKGRTAAMLAAEMGNDAITTLLAKNNANMRLKDSEGKGVLFYCIYPTKQHARCLQLALENDADANNLSDQGGHVFQLMCERAQDCTFMCLIMLDGGADPNATNQKTGFTALMGAAKAGSVPLVRAILRRGGNPNALDSQRLSAAHYAAMGGFFEVIQVLSAHSADLNVITLQACTPLHFAAATGDANCCKFLSQRGCNPKAKNLDGLLPRQIAKNAGHRAAVKELKKAERQHGKYKDPSGDTPLSDLWALTLHDWSNEYETELRQAFGKESDAVAEEKFISVLVGLKAPAEEDQLNVVVSAHIKEEGDCVNINDFFKGVKYIKKPFLNSSYMPKKKKEKGGKGGKGGKKKGKFVLPVPVCTLSPELMPRRADGGPPHYMVEAYNNRSDPLRFNRDHPPEHPIVNDSVWYLEKPKKTYVNINYCVRTGDLESLNLAFRKGVSVDVKDPYYKTPLMAACSSGNYEVAQFLLSQGADVNTCDQLFWTPLHHAAHSGKVELIELLVKAGAAVDAKALSGGTPLMRAIETSRPSCVDFLIEAGASVNAENKAGQNCLDVARAFANSEVVDLVHDKMGSLPKPKETPAGKGGNDKKPKGKGAASQVSLRAATSTTTAGKTSSQKDTKSIILQNARITTGKANAVDITFVPKTVWGQPPTTSQLMSKIERQKEVWPLGVDLEDLMMPINQKIRGERWSFLEAKD